MDDSVRAFARLHWFLAPPVHVQFLRRRALRALRMAAPDILAEARDLSRTPAAFATAWKLLTKDGNPAPWVVAAVIIDRDFASVFGDAAPGRWLLFEHDRQWNDPVPPMPDEADRRRFGNAIYLQKRDAALKARIAADPSPPASLTGRDSNLPRDLAVWAAAVVTATGRTPAPLPDDRDAPADRSRVVSRIATRLGLATPRGPGRRHL